MIKVFISYSTVDSDLVRQVANYISPHCEVNFWDQNRTLGVPVWPEIFQMIDQADLVIAIITDKTVSRGISVGQEIGRAVTNGKLIIPLVGKDVPISELGCLQGVNYQRMLPESLGPSLESVRQRVLTLSRKSDIKQFVLISLIIVVSIWALTSES